MGIMVYMMPAMMLCGFTAPVQNMPTWLQPVALMNPLTHFIVMAYAVSFCATCRSGALLN